MTLMRGKTGLWVKVRNVGQHPISKGSEVYYPGVSLRPDIAIRLEEPDVEELQGRAETDIWTNQYGLIRVRRLVLKV